MVTTQNLDQIDFKFYPKPVKETLDFEMESDGELSIFDLGHRIIVQTYFVKGKTSLELHNLNEGVSNSIMEFRREYGW